MAGNSELGAIVDIAGDGDVILVVGPENVRLRVRSLTMKATSQVFSTMLSPSWKEGRDLLENGSTEVPLPKDNAMAMKYICAIIHYRNDMVPGAIASDDILKVAVTADKYNFIDALRFASASWLLYSQGMEANDLMNLTAAAYAFQNAQAFRDLTKALILDYGGSYISLFTDNIGSVMGWKVFCFLEEQRNSARLKLGDILIGGITSGGMCVHKCGWTSKYAYAYLELLRHQGLWPTGLVTISKAIEQAESIPDPVPDERSAPCQYDYKHEVPEFRKDRQWSIHRLKEHTGLCLPCVRMGKSKLTFCDGSH
ncbi:hypothetical protein MGYG_03969 [Nannizzia gypsea CBS 118893]|uniref:BTB domain-containing protein n=1 Tax=Arthroderma gypseum (strain ATCC MYA-4604 / CBS 118893) TaxID=535722 RepID=E4UUK0_ARTGP|nr:hypothetical protein MGYG_03969 [Nannizzia gypsea CBS 118893]EFR00967.1 hypothetical protein MGYG_03969 [Nannizzia gypsea CBS 118893]